MQKISHKTRAYYINANGIKPFIVPYSCIEDLRVAEDSGELENLTKYQYVDINEFTKLFESMPTNKERVHFLSRRYPCLYIFLLKKRGMTAALNEYMDLCKHPTVKRIAIHTR